MKNHLNAIFKFLGYFIFVLILLFTPVLVGGDLKIFLQGRLGDNFLFILLPLGLVTALILTLWKDGSNFFRLKQKEVKPQNVTEENILKIREGLEESYQNRMKSKLATRYPINLELKYSLEGTSSKIPLYDNKTIRSIKIKEELISLFDKHRGRLLIVGEPGSGKTTLLIQLALKLLEREEAQIPIIINIATWRARFSSVQDWLTELLPQMGFTKALTQQILLEHRLLPLFDGLDELVEENRAACLKAIGAYGKEPAVRYVICSRIEEYKATEDAPVYCQILVKPLSLAQIKRGLKEMDTPETRGILDAIKQDAFLAEAIKTPFYLNTVQLLFASMQSWEELGFKSENLEECRKEIVEKFLKYSISHFNKYALSEAKKWLAFLADRMDKNGLVTFENGGSSI